MTDTGVKRRLAAVLAADVAAYTRLMEVDSEGTVAAWKAARTDIINPTVTKHEGRIVKLTGDGFLAEFPTVQAAVECAVEMQDRLASRPLDFRMGVNLGDIIDDGEDIHGEGVNVAARIEALADRGGICVSGSVYDLVRNRLKQPVEDIGEQVVKNISSPVRVYKISVVPTHVAIAPEPEPAESDSAPPKNVRQEIRFCTAPDGAQLAYAVVGEGPPLVKTANWMNHLEYDWESPVWSHVLHALAEDHTLIRYDQRGNGMSDWDPPEISFDAFVSDLETVVDAAGYERFDLFGISQGCAHSIAYAVRHPERVNRLILYGGFARGRFQRDRQTREQDEAILTLVKTGWGQENPAFRQIFTMQFLPEGTPEQFKWFNDLQRITISPENAAKIMVASRMINVVDLLPQVRVPTLVLHCREDQIAPLSEGRRLAAGIQGAKLVTLEGKNHLILEGEPAWPRFLDEMRTFMNET